MEEKKVLARLTGLVGELDSLKDFRVQGRTKHPLKTVVAIAIASTASVGDGYTQMEDFARRHEEFLKERLPMPNGVPSHDTFRRVISRLNAKMLERILSRWLTRQCGGLGGELVALDGKTLRRSAGEGGEAPHVENSWCDALGTALAREAVDEKSNEITAAPRILDRLGPMLEGAVVMTDAMCCQKKIARQVRSLGAHYVFALKENQGALYAESERFLEFIPEFEERPWTAAVQLDKGHGRIEKRTYRASAMVEWLDGAELWPDLASLVVVDSERTIKGATTAERRFYISSLPADAETLAPLIRRYWCIENRLHHVLDVVFREDYSRARTLNAALNKAVMRQVALTLLGRNSERGYGKKRMKENCTMDIALLWRTITGEPA